MCSRLPSLLGFGEMGLLQLVLSPAVTQTLRLESMSDVCPGKGRSVEGLDLSMGSPVPWERKVVSKQEQSE